MKNSRLIVSLSKHLGEMGELISSLAGEIDCASENGTDDLAMYADLLLEDLEQVQKLTLTLTEVVSGAVGESITRDANTDGDGSAFAQGELQSVKGRTFENPAVPEAEEEK